MNLRRLVNVVKEVISDGNIFILLYILLINIGYLTVKTITILNFEINGLNPSCGRNN